MNTLEAYFVTHFLRIYTAKLCNRFRPSSAHGSQQTHIPCLNIHRNGKKTMQCSMHTSHKEYSMILCASGVVSSVSGVCHTHINTSHMLAVFFVVLFVHHRCIYARKCLYVRSHTESVSWPNVIPLDYACPKFRPFEPSGSRFCLCAHKHTHTHAPRELDKNAESTNAHAWWTTATRPDQRAHGHTRKIGFTYIFPFQWAFRSICCLIALDGLNSQSVLCACYAVVAVVAFVFADILIEVANWKGMRERDDFGLCAAYILRYQFAILRSARFVCAHMRGL